MTALEKLLGGAARIKVLRFFLLNCGKVATPREIAKMVRISSRAASSEVRFLLSLGLIKRGARIDEIALRKRTIKKRIAGFILSEDFPHIVPLRHLVVSASPMWREKMSKYFKNCGRIKLVGLGGVFIDGTLNSVPNASENFMGLESPLDVLVVGDGIKKSKMEKFVKKMESDIGRELAWACFTKSEFEYRLAMHDKFLRDFLDYPHEFLINKLGIE